MTYIRTVLALVFLLSFFTPDQVLAIKPGESLIPIKATAMSGEKVNLEKIVRNKPVMLFFWASW